MPSKPMPILPESIEEVAASLGIHLTPAEAVSLKQRVSPIWGAGARPKAAARSGTTILAEFESLSGAAQTRFYQEHRNALVNFIKTPSK